MTTRNLLLALVAVPALLASTACNTVEGAGEDLQSDSREVKQDICHFGEGCASGDCQDYLCRFVR